MEGVPRRPWTQLLGEELGVPTRKGRGGHEKRPIRRRTGDGRAVGSDGAARGGSRTVALLKLGPGQTQGWGDKMKAALCRCGETISLAELGRPPNPGRLFCKVNLL